MKSPHSKRRSSMRRSLLETLESMPSASTDQDNASAIAHSSTAVGEPAAKKLKVDSSEESIELLNSGSYIDEKVDEFIIKELQRELDGWTKLLHKVRNNEDNAIDFHEVVKSYSIPTNPTKHNLRNQQIGELEAKFSASLEVVNALMERIHIVKANHTQNIQNISQSLYENRLEKFLSTDPKALICQILELHGQCERGT